MIEAEKRTPSLSERVAIARSSFSRPITRSIRLRSWFSGTVVDQTDCLTQGITSAGVARQPVDGWTTDRLVRRHPTRRAELAIRSRKSLRGLAGIAASKLSSATATAPAADSPSTRAGHYSTRQTHRTGIASRTPRLGA